MIKKVILSAMLLAVTATGFAEEQVAKLYTDNDQSAPLSEVAFFLAADNYTDFQIVKPEFDTKEILPLWQVLHETANKNSKEKAATPLLTGAVMRSVLDGSPYPVGLFQNIMLRVKADQDNPDKFVSKVSRIKAATIKAFLIRIISSLILMPRL